MLLFHTFTKWGILGILVWRNWCFLPLQIFIFLFCLLLPGLCIMPNKRLRKCGECQRRWKKSWLEYECDNGFNASTTQEEINCLSFHYALFIFFVIISQREIIPVYTMERPVLSTPPSSSPSMISAKIVLFSDDPPTN